MRCLLLVPALLATGGTALAQTVTLTPLSDARLRYEHVDQGGLPRDADALTARVRAGVAATTGRWTALAESEATLALIDHNFDGVSGNPMRPLVADPENIELNRLQLGYSLGKAGSITLGRQRIDLGDQRFVASAPFRQNDQTFDAVRAQLTPIANVTLDVSYAWSARTINGINGRAARQQAVSGDNFFATAAWRTGLGTLNGFAFLVDQDEAAVQGYRLSSQSYGARFAGSRPLGHGVTVNYAASVARQSDYRRNPNRYHATYWLAEGGLTRGPLTGGLGYEVLGADRGAAFTSFQTPLAALFKFQGWADRFTTTPPDGVRDRYATLTGNWKLRRFADTLTLTAVAHRFDSDRASRHYGNEMDLLAAIKRGRTTWSIRYADYDAARFATDTRKFWLAVDWSL